MGMVPAPTPADEAERLAALRSLDVLDTPADPELDALVKLAAELCGVPMAFISLIDEHRQWFKAKLGSDAAEAPRDTSYCGHAIMERETMVVPNAALDPRFADNPNRQGDKPVEFYAGVPLVMSSGHAVGTLCVVDHAPRTLSHAQQVSLEALGAQAVRLLELRRTTELQRAVLASMQSAERALRRGHESDMPEVPRTRSWLALLLAGALGAASVAATLWARSTVADTGALRLARAAERAESFFEERTRAYATILRGAGALFRASEHVTPSEFARYVRVRRLARDYPGLLGLGHAVRVPRAELATWTAAAQREDPTLRVSTSGDAPALVINRLVEPRAENARALGFDAASERVRATALALSETSHEVTLTDRLVLRQDPSHGPGFLMYLPLPESEAAGAPIGSWAFLAVRARDLVRGIDAAAGRDVELRVIDDPSLPPLLGRARVSEPPARVAELSVANRTFHLELRPGKAFWTLAERTEPWSILVLGLFATGLVFALTTSLRRVEERSQLLAKRMTEALRRGEQELRGVIDSTTDFVLTFDESGRLMLTNRAFRDVLGYGEQDVARLTLHEVLEPEARGAFSRALEAAPNGETTRFVETTFRTRAGTTIEVEGALSIAAEGEQRTTRAIFRDVSARRKAERALKAANEALERLATTDGLTGIANRRRFDERLAEEVARAKRGGTALSVVLLDVDCFKLYNDAYGHQQGDECLRRVATCFARVARRAGELAARYGGEELVLLLPNSDRDAAAKVAEMARASIEALELPHVKNPHGVVTASLGVASLDADHATPDALVAAADAALYRAKAGGRNRVES